MSSDIVETKQYGPNIFGQIVVDSHCESPYADDDNIRIVILHGRRADPAEGKCGKTPKEVVAWVKKHRKSWFAVPLWMYDHSGIALGVGHQNPFTCPFDTRRVGLIALERAAFNNAPDGDLFEQAKAIAEVYAMWANGECYGYRITVDDEVVDDCYGFIGFEHVKQEMEASARHYS